MQCALVRSSILGQPFGWELNISCSACFACSYEYTSTHKQHKYMCIHTYIYIHLYFHVLTCVPHTICIWRNFVCSKYEWVCVYIHVGECTYMHIHVCERMYMLSAVCTLARTHCMIKPNACNSRVTFDSRLFSLSPSSLPSLSCTAACCCECEDEHSPAS